VPVTADARIRARLSRGDRREQLLDATATLLVERGDGAVTMERVAEWAGVSKALPYSHFDNSDDVLVALYQRVVGELGERVVTALETSDPEDDRVALLVATYFDTVADLGPILGAVTAPGSRTSELGDGDRKVGPRFVARILTTYFDMPREHARGAGPILLGALTGAVLGWRDRAASRAELEALATAAIRGIVHVDGR
jgi:AcrR family transcriptional regulator